MNEAGYSGTPLARKLGIKENFQIHLYRPPKHFWTLFDELPAGVEQLEEAEIKSLDYLHCFVTEPEQLEFALNTLLPWMKSTGSLWISWPKKSSGIPTEVDKWTVLQMGRAVGLVDVKVAAVDHIWSGQKFMYRRSDRR